MPKSKSKYGILLRLGLIGLALVLFLRMRTKADGPKGAIQRAFQGTRYQALIPYIYKMAKLETGNFTSNLYKNHNSMFGMGVRSRWPQTRSGETACEGGSRRCATYASLEQSADDLLIWFEQHNDSINEILGSGDKLRNFVYYLHGKSYFTADPEKYLSTMRRL